MRHGDDQCALVAYGHDGDGYVAAAEVAADAAEEGFPAFEGQQEGLAALFFVGGVAVGDGESITRVENRLLSVLTR